MQEHSGWHFFWACSPSLSWLLRQTYARERNPKHQNTFSGTSRLESPDQRAWKAQR